MKKKILISTLAAMMILLVCLGIGIGASAAELPAASSGEVIDVWLIAGQSNAIGSAKVSNYPTDAAYAEYKALLESGSENVWYIGNSLTDFVPTGFGLGSGSSSAGPEIGIATALDKSANKNAIIKVAYGNSSLYNNTSSDVSIQRGTWTPPTYIDKYNINTVGNRTGDLYLTFINKVGEGLDELRAQG